MTQSLWRMFNTLLDNPPPGPGSPDLLTNGAIMNEYDGRHRIPNEGCFGTPLFEFAELDSYLSNVSAMGPSPDGRRGCLYCNADKHSFPDGLGHQDGCDLVLADAYMDAQLVRIEHEYNPVMETMVQIPRHSHDRMVREQVKAKFKAELRRVADEQAEYLDSLVRMDEAS